MQLPVSTKRKYFTKLQKLSILNELASGAINQSELARKHGIHPITLYAWKRKMSEDKSQNQLDYQEVLDENSELKAKIENLKKALADVSVEKHILETSLDIYKKNDRQQRLNTQKKSSKS